MVQINELRERLEAARDTFDYRLERVLYHVAEQVCKLIGVQQLTRRQLAQRLDVSPAYITKLLNGNPNLTIKTLLRLSDALGQTLDIRFIPKTEVASTVTVPRDNLFLNCPPVMLGTANFVTTSQPIILNHPDIEANAVRVQRPTVEIEQSIKLNEVAANHELALAA